jgi:flap endonuclease-1
MGIQKLMTLIQEKAPKAVKTINLELLTGKVVACDASMAIYQFLIAT